jgi:regulator of protease activity HflC (stomatin/prohibitin superfamily)
MLIVEALSKLITWMIPILILGLIILPQMIRILREYERGVIFRLGKLLGVKGRVSSFSSRSLIAW